MNAKRAMAMVEIGANSNKLTRELHEAQSKLRRFASTAKKTAIDFGGRTAGSIGGGITAGLGMQAAGGVTAAVANSVARVLDLEEAMVKIQLATGKTDAEMRAVRDTVTAVSSELGMSAAQVAAAGDAYYNATSDAAGLNDAMRNIAKASKATFASTEDTTKVFAALQDSMQIDSSAILKTYSSLIAIADQGKVPLAEANRQIAELAPQFAQFGVTGHEGAAQMFSLFQVISKGSGSVDKAKEDFKSLMSALISKSDVLGKHGIKVFDTGRDGVKRPREIKKVLDELAKSELAKNPDLLMKALGSELAFNAVSQLQRLPGLYDEIYAAASKTTVVEERLAKIQASRGDRVGKAKQNILNTLDDVMGASLVAIDETIQGGKFIGQSAGALLSGDRESLPQHFQETNAVRFGIARQSRAGRVYDLAKKNTGYHSDAITAIRAKGNTPAAYQEQIRLHGNLMRMARAEMQAAQTVEQSVGWESHAVAIENLIRYLQAERQTALGAFGRIVEAIKNQKVVVQLDDSTVWNRLANAAAHRAPKNR